MLNHCRFWTVNGLLLILLIGIACGGGGGAGNSNPVAPPSLTLAYTEDTNQNPTTGDVGLGLDQGASTNQQAVLNLGLQGPLSDLFGVAFHLQYDATVLTFVQAIEGNVLNRDGNPTQFLVSQGTNEIIVGLTRVGNPQTIGGTQISGNEVLCTIVFQPRAAGSTILSYTQNEIQNVSGTDITNHPWRAGTIVVN